MEVGELCLYAAVLLVLYKVCDYLYRIPIVSDLGDKWVFITGCDSGFGRVAAKRFDGHGMHVFATCLTEEGETHLRKSCSSRLKTLKMDVTDDNSVKKAYEFVKKTLPQGTGLWALLNNAGIPSKRSPIEWLAIQDYQKVMDVNVLGLIRTTMTFLPLIKQARGRVVNTSSMGGRMTDDFTTPYCMTKYAVESFSDGIRRQLALFGVTVCMVEPGFHLTSFTDPDLTIKDIDRAWGECPPEIREQYGQEYVDGFKKARVEVLRSPINSARLDDVVDAYEHAAIGRYPRGRYMVGFFTTYVFWPMSLMPEFLSDWIALKLNKDIPLPKECWSDWVALKLNKDIQILKGAHKS